MCLQTLGVHRKVAVGVRPLADGLEVWVTVPSPNTLK